MRSGDTVSVLGTLDENGRPARCTLVRWVPNVTVSSKRRGPGEWEYADHLGRRATALPDDVLPWPKNGQ